MPLTETVHQQINEYAKTVAKDLLTTLTEFNNEQCTQITNDISHKVCQFIQEKDTEFKFVVNTTLFEKGNLGITMSGTCIWDTAVDRFLNINQENEKLIIVISIWGLSCD